LAKEARRCLFSKKSTSRSFRNYVKAAESNKNDFTTPRFLLKLEK
jgi:hypothetical protein